MQAGRCHSHMCAVTAYLQSRQRFGLRPFAREPVSSALTFFRAGPVLVDPMCGSGTFLIEAALLATHAAPGLLRRRWPFERWPDFEPTAWREARAAAAAARDLSWDGQLLGNDVHDGALSLAVRCALASHVTQVVTSGNTSDGAGPDA